MYKKNPTVSVIVSTYNSPEVLRLVLLALNDQDTDDFEVIVADDGSNDDTRQVIDDLRSKVHYAIKHVWQKHDNFRAAMIRNKSVAKASSEYLIFFDGDSIPQASFVSNHKKLAEDNYFVTGNRILLSANFTKQVLANDIPIHRWRWWQWFLAFCTGKTNRFLPMIPLNSLYYRYRCRTKWYGAKIVLGMWKKDYVAINGFDERFCGWGYEDSDFFIRLIRHGVMRKDGRFMIPVIHLWHPKNSRDNEQENYKRLEETERSSHVRAVIGVDQYAL